jgi:hypothetical protein
MEEQQPKKRRGFAAMSKEQVQVQAIASKGGKAPHVRRGRGPSQEGAV